MGWDRVPNVRDSIPLSDAERVPIEHVRDVVGATEARLKDFDSDVDGADHDALPPLLMDHPLRSMLWV